MVASLGGGNQRGCGLGVGVRTAAGLRRARRRGASGAGGAAFAAVTARGVRSDGTGAGRLQQRFVFPNNAPAWQWPSPRPHRPARRLAHVGQRVSSTSNGTLFFSSSAASEWFSASAGEILEVPDQIRGSPDRAAAVPRPASLAPSRSTRWSRRFHRRRVAEISSRPAEGMIGPAGGSPRKKPSSEPRCVKRAPPSPRRKISTPAAGCGIASIQREMCRTRLLWKMPSWYALVLLNEGHLIDSRSVW